MTRRVDDLTGQKFGRLTVLHRDGSKGRAAAWACKCACGGSARVASFHLKSGMTRSCGCLRRSTFIATLATGRVRAAARKGQAAPVPVGPDLEPLMAAARAAMLKEWSKG